MVQHLIWTGNIPYYHHRKLKGGKKIRDTVRSRTKEKVERRRET